MGPAIELRSTRRTLWTCQVSTSTEGNLMTQLHQFRARLGVPRKIWSSAAAIAVTVGLLAGCSAASSTSAPAVSGGPGPTTPAVGSAGSSLDPAVNSPSSEHSRYCNAIKLPDAQVLVKDPILKDQFDPLLATPPYDCKLLTAGNDGPEVSIDTTDTFARWVAGENLGAGTALTGVGDKAVWVQVPGNPPTVIAIKGSVTCRVDVETTERTTIEFTVSSAGFNKITPAAAASFAQKMAVLCTDVFGASS